MATTLYHRYDGDDGADYLVHAGKCYSDSEGLEYDGYHVAAVELYLSDLTVHWVDGEWDHDAAEAASDHDLDSYGDADVIAYDDEDLSGRMHTTYRLVSDAAVAAFIAAATTITEVETVW